MAENQAWWRFFDGSVSVSVSMLVAVLLNRCLFCDSRPVVGFLNTLTTQDDGIIIVATMMLFPTATVLYGGGNLIFAAKEAVERRARKKGRAEGRAEYKEHLLKELKQRGELTKDELVQILEEE